MTVKIDFVIIGAQKSGTTSLHYYLQSHPEIILPEQKEISFFIVNEEYEEGIKSLDSHYKNIKPESIVGLSQVNMMFFDYVPGRVYDFNPNMKIIAVLRNPIERAYSAFWQAKKHGWENMQTFEEALEREKKGNVKSFFEKANFAYLQHGHYAEQIKPYIDLFGKENVSILMFEDLKEKTEYEVKNLIAWLGVDNNLNHINLDRIYNESGMPKYPKLQKFIKSPDSVFKKTYYTIISKKMRHYIRNGISSRLSKHNIRPFKYPPMDSGTRCFLKEYFVPYNDELSKLLDRDLSHWE